MGSGNWIIYPASHMLYYCFGPLTHSFQIRMSLSCLVGFSWIKKKLHSFLFESEKSCRKCSNEIVFPLPFCWYLGHGSHLQGHEKEALQLMATYLPKDTSPGSAYQEGGGLYALGLIHANHGGDIIDYLLNQLKNASNDVSIGAENWITLFK